MSKIEFDYYYGVEADQFSFVRVPRVFFTDKENFGTLSIEAKLLYGFLLERMGLSRKNNWLDEHNRVFIIFKIEEIADRMNCGHEKACNILKELDDENGIGLISKRRRGMGLPSIIYVKNFLVMDEQEQNTEPMKNSEEEESNSQDNSPISRSPENGNQEVGKSESNYIENNYIDLSYIENQSAALQNFSPGSRMIDVIDRIEIEEQVKEQIDYEYFSNYSEDTVVQMAEEIKDLIVDVICGERNVIIEGKKISEEAARSAYRKLTSEHVMDVMRNILNYPGKISRIDRFLTVALYNSVFTLTNQTFSGFEHDNGMKMI